MGYSDDAFPYVGPVHEKPGQFVCAGFSGHGMPQIFLSAKAIALMVTTGATPGQVDLPLPYHTSPERWFQQREHNSLQAWREVTQNTSPRAML